MGVAYPLSPAPAGDFVEGRRSGGHPAKNLIGKYLPDARRCAFIGKRCSFVRWRVPQKQLSGFPVSSGHCLI